MVERDMMKGDSLAFFGFSRHPLTQHHVTKFHVTH